MNVIVVGAGEVGAHIAERLSKEGHNVTIVEKSRDKEQLLKGKLNAMVVRGSGAGAEVLEEAGVRDADLFIAVTDQDEVNLVASLLAHEWGTRRIVARIKSLEYASAEWAQSAQKLGIDLLINPQKVVAEEIFRIVSYTAASEAAEFADGRVVFLGYIIARGNPLAGIMLRELAGVRGIYRMLITAIARKHEVIIPRGDDMIMEGDIVYFVCNKRDLPAINYLFEFEKTALESVFLLGGERVGATLARRFAGMGVRVKLIEPDAAVCSQLAEDLDNVAVLNTDGTDIETLKHEGIADCDAYIAVTGDEQTNILCALLAKSYGAKRVIALVDRHELVGLAPSLGVDVSVSPRVATANAILRYVRPKGVASVATVEHSDSEVLEVVVSAESPIVGQALREVNFPSGSIIGVIVRGEEVIIPTGDDRFAVDDHVIVFALPESISQVERLFP